MSNFEIVAREDFSDVTYLLEVHHPLMAKAAKPGQFVIVMLDEQGERIPLTIADYDTVKGTITLVIQAVGKTTRQMQDECQVGTTLYAMVGPMGVPSTISHAKKVVCAPAKTSVRVTNERTRETRESSVPNCDRMARPRESRGRGPRSVQRERDRPTTGNRPRCCPERPSDRVSRTS